MVGQHEASPDARERDVATAAVDGVPGIGDGIERDSGRELGRAGILRTGGSRAAIRVPDAWRIACDRDFTEDVSGGDEMSGRARDA
jgi:hypothetical protein